jgi:hypothetical protein
MSKAKETSGGKVWLHKTLFIATIAPIVCSPSYSETMSSFSIGSTAPDIHMVTQTGKKLTLASYLGTKRLVLLFVPPSCEKEAQGYLEHLSNIEKSLEERDLQIIAFVSQSSPILRGEFGKSIVVSSESDYLPAASANADAAPLFVLIGKDQSIKLREPQFVSEKALFATIDAMPMRKDEVRKRQGKKTY